VNLFHFFKVQHKISSLELHQLQITIMSTCTTKSWDVTSRRKELNLSFYRGFIVLLLTFIWLSSFAETKEKHLNNFETAATLAAFEGCENNFI